MKITLTPSEKSADETAGSSVSPFEGKLRFAILPSYFTVFSPFSALHPDKRDGGVTAAGLGNFLKFPLLQLRPRVA
jgi:hypothetical protein